MIYFSLETVITIFEVIKRFGGFCQISLIYQGIWACLAMEIIEHSGNFFCRTRLGTLLMKIKYLSILDFYLTNSANIVSFVALVIFLFFSFWSFMTFSHTSFWCNYIVRSARITLMDFADPSKVGFPLVKWNVVTCILMRIGM